MNAALAAIEVRTPDGAPLLRLGRDRLRAEVEDQPVQALVQQAAGALARGTNGNSFPATLNGGTGDDLFDIFRNKSSP